MNGGENHFTPPTDEQIKEGEFTRELLKSAVGKSTVIEFGCGEGRVAGNFNSVQYRGFDINPEAIRRARENNPRHRFDVYVPFDELPKSKWVYAHTVLLHVDDCNILPILNVMTMKTRFVVISEIMSRKFRPINHRNRIPPVFNRNREEYVDMMDSIGFKVIDEKGYFFKRYGTNINYIFFERFQTLNF
jgi:SAM-dependent methyltransferase